VTSAKIKAQISAQFKSKCIAKVS